MKAFDLYLADLMQNLQAAVTLHHYQELGEGDRGYLIRVIANPDTSSDAVGQAYRSGYLVKLRGTTTFDPVPMKARRYGAQEAADLVSLYNHRGAEVYFKVEAVPYEQECEEWKAGARALLQTLGDHYRAQGGE